MPKEYSEIMRAFANRKYLSKRQCLKYSANGGWPYLELDSPLVLARFNAEIRQAVSKKCPAARVYCRGQDKHFDSMRPSLFRSSNSQYSKNHLLDAQAEFESALRNANKPRRFHREHLAALLQHYGFRTSWLDVVDNLYVATWFATHSKSGNTWIDKRIGEYGWLYFISTASPTTCLTVVDLRGQHHHLSTRPQTQHGVSVTRDENKWSSIITDLDEFVVATVRLRYGPQWRLRGFMASEDFLFPNSIEDNTLKILQRRQTSELLRRIERKHGLCAGTLGSLSPANNRRETTHITSGTT